MTTPLSKMVALLIPSSLTPKRGLGSAGSLSEAKKGVAKVCGEGVWRSLVIHWRLQSTTDSIASHPWATRVAQGPPRVNHFFGFSIIVQKNCMIQVALCEQALIKTNRKPLRNHQSKAMLLFKTYTLEFEFDRHLKHMISYQEMQSGFPYFLLVNSALSRFLCKNDCRKIDHIWAEYDHILLFTNHKSALL